MLILCWMVNMVYFCDFYEATVFCSFKYLSLEFIEVTGSNSCSCCILILYLIEIMQESAEDAKRD